MKVHTRNTMRYRGNANSRGKSCETCSTRSQSDEMIYLTHRWDISRPPPFQGELGPGSTGTMLHLLNVPSFRCSIFKDTRSNSKYGSNWFDSNLAHWACYRVLIIGEVTLKARGQSWKLLVQGIVSSGVVSRSTFSANFVLSLMVSGQQILVQHIFEINKNNDTWTV